MRKVLMWSNTEFKKKKKKIYELKNAIYFSELTEVVRKTELDFNIAQCPILTVLVTVYITIVILLHFCYNCLGKKE